MSLKEKRDESIKGRIEADRRKQGEKIKPKDATSLTVSIEAVMLTARIYTLKGRDVVVVDIPGEYLSPDMGNEVHLVFIGTLADTMVTAGPELYWTFMSYETGKAVIYVLPKKEL